MFRQHCTDIAHAGGKPFGQPALFDLDQHVGHRLAPDIRRNDRRDRLVGDDLCAMFLHR